MAAADSTTNSSKVIVQCHDPNDVFDHVVSRFEPRLPLSKLHWKSPNRPLRSIDQLNVSFIKDDSTSDASAGARRHQIPGLRQTPFVKLYLVRCDDRENYKETSRKEIKQWLKSQGISQDGKTLMKGQERHDAYEYIILHVVFPGTPAAAQPKSSKHISLETADSTDSVNSKSKWTGKSSSTIFDKLRADFSSSSKAPFERVAQVRITDTENKQPTGLGSSELEELWQDFTEKLKTAILLSFDARVSQYEEDIREREAQRRLPGWNFCTFFVLKEGLARGFENVGLIEDARTIYEELDAELDTIVQEHNSQEEPDPTSALLPFSSDLKPIIRAALDEEPVVVEMDAKITDSINLQTLIELERSNFPFDILPRKYQERILTTQVSALDFHIYIFTRQLMLQFRQAGVASLVSKPRNSTASITVTQYNLKMVAEICEKATSFITFAARALRRDLYAAWGGQEGLDEHELYTQKVVIDGIVASWKWSAVMQILADCYVLTSLKDVLVNHSPPSDDQVVAYSAPPVVNGHNELADPILASWAGELIAMARDILQSIIVSSSEDSHEDESAKGLRSQSLSFFFQNRDQATEVYSLLTIYTFQCFQCANRINASHRMLHALAEMETQRGHVGRAIWWLEHIPNLSNLNSRTSTDRILLKLYAKCLKSHGRLDDYATTMIALLLSSVSSPIARALPQYDEQTQSILDELVKVSKHIADFELPLNDFFMIQNIAESISHDHETGFTFCLSLALRFHASIEISDLNLILVADGGQEPSQITMVCADRVTLHGSSSLVKFTANIITEGWYKVGQLAIRIGRLLFVHHFNLTATQQDGIKATASNEASSIIVYPHNDALSLNMRSSPSVDLTQSGKFLLELLVGESSIQECTIRIWPATAGVRLDIQAAKILPFGALIDFEVARYFDANTIVVRSLSSRTKVAFEVPYSVEILANSISTKIECVCQGKFESFHAYYRPSTIINLPISVNVHDIFQAERSFSRFTAIPSTSAPIKVLKWHVEENSTFEIRPSNVSEEPMDVFKHMPASWVIETRKRRLDETHLEKLPLLVQYQSYDDIVLDRLENQFRHDLQASPVSFAERLLVAHLLVQIPEIWTEQGLETAVLTQEFEIMSYDALAWEGALRAFNSANRKTARSWLQSWHSIHRYLDLSQAGGTVREVRLFVEMPTPAVIVSTSITIHQGSKQYIAIGEAVVADLTIRCVSNMADDAMLQFEVTSQPEIWLLGGKKKGMVNARTSESKFIIILIAQRTGHLLLPGIDVRCYRSQNRRDSTGISIEVESQSQAKTILVTPNLQSSTMVIGGDNLPGRYWPIESRRRLEAT